MSEEVRQPSPTLRQFFRSAPYTIKLRLMVVGLLAVAVVLTSSLMILEVWKAHARFRPVPKAHPQRMVASEPFSQTYELRKVSLSLSDRSGRRSGYAQFTLVLDLPSPEARRWCELNRAQMIHVILEQGARFQLEDFDTPRGYELLKEALHSAFKERFAQHAPREILLKDFTSH